MNIENKLESSNALRFLVVAVCMSLNILLIDAKLKADNAEADLVETLTDKPELTIQNFAGFYSPSIATVPIGVYAIQH